MEEADVGRNMVIFLQMDQPVSLAAYYYLVLSSSSSSAVDLIVVAIAKGTSRLFFHSSSITPRNLLACLLPCLLTSLYTVLLLLPFPCNGDS
jgi:hypothetical protein